MHIGDSEQDTNMLNDKYKSSVKNIMMTYNTDHLSPEMEWENMQNNALKHTKIVTCIIWLKLRKKYATLQ